MFAPASTNWIKGYDKMQLKEFRIQNYRSIDDSGPITVSKLTALLGRNESGKSNLLHALQTLNPVEGSGFLDKDKDFPRHWNSEKCTDSTPVVTSTWKLSEVERKTLAKIWSRGKSATTVTIERQYGEQRIVEFPDISDQDFSLEPVKIVIQQVVPIVRSLSSRFSDNMRPTLENLANRLEKSIESADDLASWLNELESVLIMLRQVLESIDHGLTEAQVGKIAGLEHFVATIAKEVKAWEAARAWVLECMPIFIFFDQYPRLSGYQDVSAYLNRKAQNQSTLADQNFDKMCKVAGLNPEELHALWEQNKPEIRNHRADQASTAITEKIQHLWKDRPLKVHFVPDGNHIHTFISNPSDTRDVKINLDDRSHGFQWFFSFYVTFAADTGGGDAANAILLLDEPGLYLHAKSQGDLLKHLKEDFKNQILYTTHSPFMVPTCNLEAIRTVNISKEARTTVSNDPSGDSSTLFPLQAALGYDLAQSLFVGPNNLIVEGVTDYWVLSSISDYLHDKGKTALRSDITITPAGTAQKIPYMVSLLSSEKLNVLVLFDCEKNAMMTRDNLVKTKLIQDKNVIFVSEAFGDSAPKEADIEDLLDSKVYEKLVRESYAHELEGVDLSINKKIPRIAKRFEEAFKKAKLEFHKTRPMRLLLTKMGDSPDDIVTSDVAARFSKLNGIINTKLKSMIKKN